MPQKHKENKQEDTQLPDDNIVTKQMPSVCSNAPQNPTVHVCSLCVVCVRAPEACCACVRVRS